MYTLELRHLIRSLFVLSALSVAGHAQVTRAAEPVLDELVFPEVMGDRVVFQPLVNMAGLSLSVSKPDGQVLETVFPQGTTPAFVLGDSITFPDGAYSWEVRALPSEQVRVRTEEGPAAPVPSPAPLVQSGAFHVAGGTVMYPGSVEDYGAVKPKPDLDTVILDDLIVDGSACIGFDCVNGESFGFDTVRLKENNLRLHFQDTSNSASFPTNDWRITVNDSSNGGQNKFSIDDVDGGRTPFTIEAGASSHSLYVDDAGRVGLGTSTPVVELHTKDGDTPTLRLEQDGTSGFTPQTWDVAANETNFFIRDATNGSKLPFRIKPNAPSDSLSIDATGSIGLGTSSPMAAVHLSTPNGKNAALLLQRADGATGLASAGGSVFTIGSTSDHVVQVIAGEGAQAGWKMKIFPDQSLQMRNGATCTAAGVWTDASSQASRTHVRQLSTDEALEALAGLNPVQFESKFSPGEKHVGFNAEEAPDLVAPTEEGGMSAMDVTAVLTKVVQEQQRMLDEQRALLEKQGREIRALQSASRVARRSDR